MNGWIKFFADGSQVKGLDMDIMAGTASWSKSRFEGLEKVELRCGKRKAVLECPGERNWHQFDRMIVPVGIGKHIPLRSHRVVQAQINPVDINKHLNIYPCNYWSCVAVLGEQDNAAKQVVVINEETVGKWVTVVLPGVLPVQATEKMDIPKIHVFVSDRGDWRG